MHTYREKREGGNTLYTVGFDPPTDGTENSSDLWRPMYDTTSRMEAWAIVSYLNGGTRPAGDFR